LWFPAGLVTSKAQRSGAAGKFEIRSSKSEGNPNIESRKLETDERLRSLARCLKYCMTNGTFQDSSSEHAEVADVFLLFERGASQ
jgi:hypothetical protein